MSGSNTIELSAAAIEAIAKRVVELQRVGPLTDSDPWLTREQAAAYLNFELRTFDRKRKLYADALKPCELHPMRWSRNALDVFKLTRGRPLHHKRGPKRQEAIAA